MGVMRGLARGVLPGDAAPVLNPFHVQGASMVLVQNEIDKTELHVAGGARKMVRWSDAAKWSDVVDKVPIAAKDASNTVAGTGVVNDALVLGTVSQSSAPLRSAPAITFTMSVSGKREVSTQGQPDTFAWKYGTVTAMRGCEEDEALCGMIGEISDGHGARYLFLRQNNAYSGLKEGEQVKFRVQQNTKVKGRQAIYITREEPPAAPSAKKQAQSVVPVVVSAKVKSNSTANQPRKVAPTEKQERNAKSVLFVQTNSRGRLTFASAVSSKLELRTDGEQPRGVTAVVPSGIDAVEARMKAMEESVTAMVKRVHELLPLPDPRPPFPRI